MEIGQGSSWIPATPGKPNFTESPTICSNGQENQQAQVDWSDLQRKQALEHATGSTAEAQNAAAYRSSTSSVEEDQCFMTSEAAVGEKSEMCGGSINMYNNFASDNVDLWSSVSFGDLLAMAHAGGSGTTPADETAYSVKSSFQPLINTQNADLPLPLPPGNQQPVENQKLIKSGPIIEVPATPEPIVEVPSTPEQEQIQAPEIDIEDAYFEDPNEIPMIELNMAEFTQNVKKYVENNMELHQVEMSNALVALTSEAASIPTPKLKNVSRLRTEHQVYELPDSHPLLEGLDKREPDDPSSYLLAIWTPGETANSMQPPETQCNSQESGQLCEDETCSSCNSTREAQSQTVRGTLLIPCRTAMRGSFPLNGTYFQVNEVFADHDSSLNPINVPRDWLWNLPRRTVYFGTSIPTIFKGLNTESIQHCFWRGFVCVRGFDHKTRAPRPLLARFHFPASKLNRTNGKTNEDKGVAS